MKKYEITYQLTTTRKMTVLAESEEEAKIKYEDGEYVEDAEDTLDNDIVVNIEEVD